MWIRDFIANLILLYWAGVFTWLFIMIIRYGVIYITEVNPYILWSEVVISPAIGVWALWRVVKGIRRFKK